MNVNMRLLLVLYTLWSDKMSKSQSEGDGNYENGGNTEKKYGIERVDEIKLKKEIGLLGVVGFLIGSMIGKLNVLKF